MKLQGRAREMALVQDEDLWLNWPVQTMVRRERRGDDMSLDNLGLLLADHGPRVYPGNLWTGPTKGIEPTTYPDWDGLLDEWRVD